MLEQGLYSYGKNVIYIALEKPSDRLLYILLSPGTKITGYSAMSIANPFLTHNVTPLVVGWLPNDAIPSELYPEYFI